MHSSTTYTSLHVERVVYEYAQTNYRPEDLVNMLRTIRTLGYPRSYINIVRIEALDVSWESCGVVSQFGLGWIF